MTRGWSSRLRGATSPTKAGDFGGAGEVASDGLGLLVMGGALSLRDDEDESGVRLREDEETGGESARGGRVGEVRP